MSRIMPSRCNAVVKSSSGIGTTEWMPPEVLAEVQHFEKTRQRGVNIQVDMDFRTDIFSAGCLLYFIISKGTHLYGEVFFRETNILKGLRDFQALEIPDDFKSLLPDVYYMTHKDPGLRPAVQDLLTRCSFWDAQKRREFLSKVLQLFEISEDLEVHIDKLKERLERYGRLMSAGPVPSAKSSVKSNQSGVEFTKSIILEKLEDEMKESPEENLAANHGCWPGPRYPIFHLFLWEAVHNSRRNPLVSKYYKFASDPFPNEVIDIFDEMISTSAKISPLHTNWTTTTESAYKFSSTNDSSNHYRLSDRQLETMQTQPPMSPNSDVSTVRLSETSLQNPMLININLSDIEHTHFYDNLATNRSVATTSPAQGSIISDATTALTNETFHYNSGLNEQMSDQTHYFEDIDLDKLLYSPVTTNVSGITDTSANQVSHPTGKNFPEPISINVPKGVVCVSGMENWQREHNRDNLPHLMKTICCDEDLLNGLYELDVLSDSDLKMLLVKRSSDGQYETTKYLLDILVMRTGAYQELTRFLYLCKQNRPFLILLHGVQTNIPNENPFDFCRISLHEEDRAALLSSNALFQGASFPLKDICKPLDDSYLQKLITDNLDAALYETFLTKKPISIAIDTIPRQLPYYIPRTLNVRSQLDPKIFERLKDDVFCIEGFTLNQLYTLANSGSYTTSRTANQTIDRSRNQYRRVTARFILLESFHHFSDIENKTEKMVHCVEHQDGHFFYHKSNREIGVKRIQEFLIDENQVMLYEEELIEMCLDVPAISPILICDSSGMGKSVLLTELARQVKRQRPENLVVFLQFPVLIRNIDCPEGALTSSSVTQTIAKLITTNKFGRAIIEYLLTAHSHHLFLFLDAYDEVPGRNIDLAYTILDCIVKELIGVRMFITTGPHKRKELEDKFGVLAYNILPFDDYNKTKFFIDYWRTEHKIRITETTKAFADHCLKSISFGGLNEQCDIAAIPLQCKMLADTFVRDAKRDDPMRTVSDLNLDSIHIMCKRLMDMRFSVFDTATAKTLRDMHVKEGVRVLFSRKVEFEVATTSGACGVPDL